jgi:hypothetical protein
MAKKSSDYKTSYSEIDRRNGKAIQNGRKGDQNNSNKTKLTA